MTLQRFFKEYPSTAFGFSGGVDSSYLLYAGRHYGADIHAYFVKTAFQPAFELDDACRIAEQVGAKMTVIPLDILAHDAVVANAANRCYHCKQAIFSAIAKQAESDGYSVIIDGSNASDNAGDRPGMRALNELSVRSPLRESGITKSEVRRLSKDAGLFTHDKPAYACLATRIPTDVPITADMLSRVEKAEDALFSLGFSDFRVRVLSNTAKLQLSPDQMAMALDKREVILNALAPYFPSVLLDLEGR